MPIQRHTHPKRDQDDNGHNELGEDAIAHFAFAFSPSLTGRPVASERDENIAEWIITNAAQSAPHEEAGRSNFPISK